LQQILNVQSRNDNHLGQAEVHNKKDSQVSSDKRGGSRLFQHGV